MCSLSSLFDIHDMKSDSQTINMIIIRHLVLS